MATFRIAAAAAGWVAGVLFFVSSAGAQQAAAPSGGATEEAPVLQFYRRPAPPPAQAAPQRGPALESLAPMSLGPAPQARRQALDEAVRERLRVSFPSLHDNVLVQVTKEGIVRLSGTVDSFAAKLAVGDKASEVPDYEYLVVNDIQVRAPRRQDEAIERDVTQAFQRDPVLGASGLQVGVQNQIVILEGVPSDAGLVQRALQTAARVPGVREVLL